MCSVDESFSSMSVKLRLIGRCIGGCFIVCTYGKEVAFLWRAFSHLWDEDDKTSHSIKKIIAIITIIWWHMKLSRAEMLYVQQADARSTGLRWFLSRNLSIRKAHHLGINTAIICTDKLLWGIFRFIPLRLSQFPYAPMCFCYKRSALHHMCSFQWSFRCIHPNF